MSDTHQLSSDYLEWRSSLDKSGFIYDMFAYYYDNTYTYQINGKTMPVGVLTSSEWLKYDQYNPADFLNRDEQAEQFVDEDESDLRQYVSPIAHRKNRESREPTDYIWNGDSLTVASIDSETNHISLKPTTFFTHASSFARIREPVYEALYNSASDGLDAKSAAQTLQNTLPPRHKQSAGSLDSFLSLDEPMPIGCCAVTLCNTNSGYKAIVAQQSEDTGPMSGWFGVRPAGYIDDEDCPDSELFESTILREFGEEVLGVDEHDGDVKSHEAITSIDNQQANGGVQIDYVGMHINPIKGNLTLGGLLLIDDPDFYHTYLEDEDLGNWEGRDVQFVPVSDKDALEDILVNKMKPNHQLPLVQALIHARDTYGIPLGVDLARVKP